MMGHASEIISVDVYTDKTKIIADCLFQLEPFIDLVLPNVIDEIENKDLFNDYVLHDDVINDLLEKNDEDSY